LRDHPRSSNQIGVRFSGFGSIGVAFRAFPPCSFVSSLVKGLLPPSLAISPRRTPTRLLGDSYGGLVAMAYPAAHPEHVAKLILSDSPGPSWQSIVDLLLPDVFPDIEEENKQEAQKLGPETEAAARAGLRNHFRMIFYSPEKRDAYMSRMGDLGYEPAIGEAVAKATADLDLTLKAWRISISHAGDQRPL
jgi:pimeloyl-ACP methyl ester carboxylesterase